MWLVWLFWTWLLIWLNKDSFQTYYRSCLARITYQVWNCKVTVIFDPPLVQILHLCKCICQNFIPKYFCQFSTTSTSFHTLKQLIYKEKSDICNKLNVWVNKLEVSPQTLQCAIHDMGCREKCSPSPSVPQWVVYRQNVVKYQKYKGTNIPDGGGGGQFLIFYPFFQKY